MTGVSAMGRDLGSFCEVNLSSRCHDFKRGSRGDGKFATGFPTVSRSDAAEWSFLLRKLIRSGRIRYGEVGLSRNADHAAQKQRVAICR
jgi:hypothetical protein